MIVIVQAVCNIFTKYSDCRMADSPVQSAYGEYIQIILLVWKITIRFSETLGNIPR